MESALYKNGLLPRYNSLYKNGFYLDIIRKFVPSAAESVHASAVTGGHQHPETRAVATANDKQPVTPLKSSKMFKHIYISG